MTAASPAFRGGINTLLTPAFWTARGYAVADVDHRGSTGYGRAYREALLGRWGEVDVEDAVSVGRHLVSAGVADCARVAVVGRSAGGFTAVAALAFRDFFCAGISVSGVVDLEDFAGTTRRATEHYLHHLVGPLPESRPLYRQRSPLQAAAAIDRPLLLIHGLDDQVVSPRQPERLCAAIRARGGDVEHVAFPGEGHMLARRESVVRAAQAMEHFLLRVLRLNRL